MAQIPIINAQLDTLNRGMDAQNAVLTAIANKMGAFDEPLTFAALQAAVRSGVAPYLIAAGDQVIVPMGAEGARTDFTWDVMGLDEDCPVDQLAGGHCLALQMHQLRSAMLFDPPQYLFPITAESLASLGISGNSLPAGTYNVTSRYGRFNGTGTSEDGTFQFTTTVAVPIGGGIRHTYMGQYQSSASSYSKAKVLAGSFITYDSDTLTMLETLLTTEGSGGINLGTTTAFDPQYKVGDYINYTQRQFYGSNRWSTSWMRQYFHSADAALLWEPKTIWSRDSSTFHGTPGFLTQLDPDFATSLGKVRRRWALALADGGGYEDVEDKITLISRTAVRGTTVAGVAEGAVDANGNLVYSEAYSYYSIYPGIAGTIKYTSGGSAQYWRCGSIVALSDNANNPSQSYGFAPTGAGYQGVRMAAYELQHYSPVAYIC